jgi:hypothetical protein
MINLLKDYKGNTLRVETCKYCLDPRGKPKIILPEDLPSAIRMPDGSYKCEPCQIEEIQNKILKITPNSDRAKEILRERAAKQKKDLEPWARQITEGRAIDDAFIKRLMNNSEVDQWDIQFRGILLKTIQAQAKYIELLERKV